VRIVVELFRSWVKQFQELGVCHMMPNLSQMTFAELKRYLSEHRNDQEAFRAALEVLMSRRNPANRQPSPFELANPESEVEAILKEKLKQVE
jgi:hypothetical protein